MKLVKKINYRCNAIVQSGEYMIDRWDNRRCEETNLYYLASCEGCNEFFCLNMHWPKHECAGE